MRRTSLDAISAPTPVYVHGTVVSTSSEASPVTGARAALIQWHAFERRGATRGWGGEFEEHIASGIVGDSVTVRSDRFLVKVPTRYLEIYVAAANAEPHLLLEPLPPGLAVLTTLHRALDCLRRGDLYYREHLIEEGALVRLRAVVTPHTGSSVYRTAADEELIAVDELEHPTLSIDVPEFA